MTAHALKVPQRRGACPGLSTPMATGDGLLVRLMPIGTMTLDAFVGLCSAAQRHGNGVVEVTSRGSIQIRGLSPASAPHFASTIAALGVAAEDGIPILSNPLAGLDPEEPIDASALAAAARRALAHSAVAPRLSAKVSIAIDGGGSLSLDGIAADVRLCAACINGRVGLRLSLGGDETNATQLGVVALNDGSTAIARLLGILAQRGRTARVRDVIAAEGIEGFRAAIADLIINDVPRPPARRHEAIGTHRLRDGSLARGVGLAFGHADAEALQRLAEAARVAGASGMRTAPGRVLMIIGLTPQAATSFVDSAEALGFIVNADDPRRHVVACAGAPVCAAAEIAARAIAPQIATTAAPQLDGSFKIHVSGCAKGCAHPTSAALTIVGTSTGCALIANGSAHDAPFKVVAVDDLPAAVAAFAREDRHVGERHIGNRHV